MEVTKTICAARVVVDDAVLLVRRARNYQELAAGAGFWELPGGAPEFGEDLAAAVRRELREEVGIVLPETPPPAVLDARAWCLTAGRVRAYRIAVVYAVSLATRPDIRLGEELAEFAFVDARQAHDRVSIAALGALLRRHAPPG